MNPESHLPAVGRPQPAAQWEQQPYRPFNPADEDEEGPPQLKRYLAAIKRFRWLILGITVVGTVIGVLSTRFLKPQYRAQSTIWIENSGRLQAGDAQPLTSGNLLSSEAWVDLLKTFVVLDEVVLRERLYLDVGDADRGVFSGFALGDSLLPGAYTLRVSENGDTYDLRSSEGRSVETGAVGDSIGRRFGFLWQPRPRALYAGREIDFTIAIPRDAALKLQELLTPRMDRNGNFLRISLTGPEPGRVARTVNAVIDRYIEVAADLKGNKLIERTDVLEEQLQRAFDNLTAAETALQSYRIETITLPSDPGMAVNPGIDETTNTAFSAYFQQQVQREGLRRDRETILSELGRAASAGGISIAALEFIPSVQASTELRQALNDLTTKQGDLRALQTQFTDEHEPVQRLMADIDELKEDIIPGIARELVRQLSIREEELSQAIDAAGEELEDIPPRAIEQARLRRDVAIAENLYTTLQARFEQARLSAMSVQADVEILDRAVAPQDPFKNSANRLMAIGFMLSLGAGIGLAILLDQLDTRIRYPEQVTKELGLPILAAIPSASNHGRGAGGNGMSVSDTYHILEALRGARMNLSYACGGTWPLTVAITSPGSGDGKSFLSANLALSFSEGGSNTILIDGDLRRGGLHKSLGMDRRPGLSDYLCGSASVQDIVQHSAFGSLDFIGRGTSNPAALDLLGSSVLTVLLEELRETYKIIILDSPPLGAGIDAFQIGAKAGALCLVVRRGLTSKELAEAKVEMLNRLPIRVLGAVFNDVSSEESTYGLHSYYMDGYGPDQMRPEDDAEQHVIGSGKA